jgi:acyl-CoA synthetase (AMP-forming)/AMP-acid ligase II
VTTETWLGAPALSYPRRLPSVARVLDRAVARWPHAPAARDTSGEVSHAGLANRVAATVTALHGAGLRRGDAVAVVAANSIDHLVLVLACARGGFVVSGFDLKLAPARWGELLAITGARLALADPARIAGWGLLGWGGRRRGAAAARADRRRLGHLGRTGGPVAG